MCIHINGHNRIDILTMPPAWDYMGDDYTKRSFV